MYSASLASRMEKIWWMARGMTPAELVRVGALAAVPWDRPVGAMISPMSEAGWRAHSSVWQGSPLACLHAHLSGRCSRILE